MSHYALFAMLKAEHRALYKLNMLSTTELHTSFSLGMFSALDHLINNWASKSIYSYVPILTLYHKSHVQFAPGI